jgi:hypothetical protein
MTDEIIVERDLIQVVTAETIGPQGPQGASGTGQSELAYADISSNVAIGTGSLADIAGLSVTFTAGARPVMLRLWIPTLFTTTAGAGYSFAITDASNVVITGGGINMGPLTGGIVFGDSTLLECRASLTDGLSYTYKARAYGTVAGTLVASATSRAFLQVLEV